MRTRLSFALAVTLTLSVAACGGGPDEEGGAESYRVAIVSELTGPAADPAGINHAAGAMAYFEQLNAAGGINGHLIDYGTPYDTQGDATAASAAIRRALEQDPIAITGYILTNSVAGAEAVLDSAGVPALLLGGPDEWLGPPPKPWYFNVGHGNWQQGAALTRHAAKMLGGLSGKKVALVGLQSTAVDGAYRAAKAEIAAAGGTVTSERQIPLDQVDYTADAAAIVAEDPDVVQVYLIGTAATSFVKELQTAGYDGPILAWSAGAATHFLAEINSDNYYAVRDAVEPLETNVLGETAKAHGLADRATNIDFAAGWAAAKILAEALKVCNGCRGQELIKTLEDLPPLEVSEAFVQPLEWTADDHFGSRGYTLYQYDAATRSAVPASDPVVVSPNEAPRADS